MSTISASTTTTTAYKVTADTTGTLVLQTGSTPTTAVTIDTSQNMGLGVTPSAWSGYKAIDITSGGAIFGYATNYAGLASNCYNNGSGWKYKNTATAGLYQLETNTHVWYTAASGTAGNAITFTQAMTLDSSGNFGIGVTGVKKRLTVSDASSSSTTPGTNPVVWVGGGNVTLNTLSEIGFTYGASSWSDSNVLATVGFQLTSTSGSGKGALTFCTRDVTTDTAPTERARIDSSGNLLVNTTTLPSSSGSGVQIYNNSGQAGRLNIGKNTSGLFNAIANYYSGTYVGGVNYDNTNTTFPTSSDVRLKKDIVDAGSASAKIDKIRIVSHGWKHDDAVVEFGVIAQELVNVAPQAVCAGDDGEEVEVTWGVDYSKLVPMLIKAHQEQQAIIETLTSRITALENK